MEIQNLNGNPGNPRTITDKKLKLLKNSLEKFGDLGGFVFNKKSQTLVGGHQRAKIFDKSAEIVIENLYQEPTRTGTTAEGYVVLKGERFKYREVNWDDATEKAANIAANKGAGEWDAGKLMEWFSELNDLKFDLDLTMFDEAERIKFLKEPVNEGLCGEDEIPEVVEPKTKSGDLYKLGNHRLLCGDSTNAQHVERLMSGEKADMVFTDPPYGIEYDDKTRKSWTRQSETAKQNNFGQIKNDSTEIGEFVNAILGYFDYCNRIFIWGILNGNGTVPKGSFIVWDRKTEAMADCPFGDFDICWSKNVGWKMIRVLWGGYISKEKGEQRLHPTQKPITLVQEFFERWGKSNDLVADLFLGSGSTLIACEKTNRKCYGLEIDPHYCDVIVARWEKFTGLNAELLPDNQGGGSD